MQEVFKIEARFKIQGELFVFCIPLKYGLLICGEMPPAMHRRGITYARLLSNWLGAEAPKASLRTYRAYAGKLPKTIEACDCYFVSGSRHSLLEGTPWIKALCNFLLVASKAQVPVVGICFGHQALAQSLGGRVKHRPDWNLGVCTWKVVREEGWMRECGRELSLLAINRDQIEKLPPRSVRVATKDDCPNGLFRIANHAIGMQGHPEFTPEIVEELIALRSDDIPPEQAKAALASLSKPTQSSNMASWCANFVSTRV